jgi:hypothetical protein
MTDSFPLKRIFLLTLIVTLCISALIGVYAFLFGQFGDMEIKILLTTLSISYFSIISLACAAAFEMRRGSILAPIGLIVSLLGIMLFLPGIWGECFDSEAYAKTMGIVAIAGFAFAHFCLLAIVPLETSKRWTFYATSAFIFALAIHLSSWIIFEFDNEEWHIRIAGILGILDGCGSLIVPILYKLSGGESSPPPSGRLDRIQLSCPRCGEPETYDVGTILCNKCGLKMNFQIVE